MTPALYGYAQNRRGLPHPAQPSFVRAHHEPTRRVGS